MMNATAERKDTFGARLKGMRESKGMRQIDVAHALEIDPRLVSNWETDTTKPSFKSCIALANLFCVSLDLLMTGEETRH